MELLVGTSGFSFPEWKGSFYPADIAGGEMLRYYGERLGALTSRDGGGSVALVRRVRTRGGIRTHTDCILRAVPLPLGYPGELPCYGS